MDVQPASEQCGVVVTDVDLRGMTDETALALAVLLLRHGVVVVRGQDLSSHDHVAVTRALGVPETYRRSLGNDYGLGEAARHLFRISNDRAYGNVEVGHYWHTDGYIFPHPTAISLLRPVILPAEGGDTYYADMGAALRALPPDLFAALEGRTAAARPAARGLGQLGRTQAATAHHPVFRPHPVTGRVRLYLNLRNMVAIEGHTPDEVADLRERLTAFVEHGDFVYRHHWEPGDLVLWDNSNVAHRATALPGGTLRLMERTSTAGRGWPDLALWRAAARITDTGRVHSTGAPLPAGGPADTGQRP